jgi:hypothetical protein
VIRWNQAVLQAVRDTRMAPPQTARALAIVHTSMHDAAAAEVLRRLTGRDTMNMTATVPAGSSPVEAGFAPAADIILTWRTFSAADEAGLSRRYGGIHFEAGDLHGRQIGRHLGAQAWRRAASYFRGQPHKPVGATRE